MVLQMVIMKRIWMFLESKNRLIWNNTRKYRVHIWQAIHHQENLNNSSSIETSNLQEKWLINHNQCQRLILFISKDFPIATNLEVNREYHKLKAICLIKITNNLEHILYHSKWKDSINSKCPNKKLHLCNNSHMSQLRHNLQFQWQYHLLVFQHRLLFPHSPKHRCLKWPICQCSQCRCSKCLLPQCRWWCQIQWLWWVAWMRTWCLK